MRETSGDRIVSVLRCPKDGRAMARVLATSRGRVLEIIAARVGFTGEIHRAVAKLASGRLAAAAQVFEGRTMRVHAKRYLIVCEPLSLDEAGSGALRPGDSRSVACPLCHRLRRRDRPIG